MRPASNCAVSELFVLSLLTFAISACAESRSRSNPMGVVVEAGRKWEKNDAQREKRDAHAEGATIYDGEELHLEEANYAVLELGKSRISLNPSPQGQGARAVLHQLASGFSIDLSSGTVRIATDERDRFVIIADGIKVEPLRIGPASAEITCVSNAELVLEL